MTNDKLAVIEPRGNQMITPAGTINEAIMQFRLYQELKEKLGNDDDFQPISGKKHPKKSFVRKVQKFFNLSCEITKDEPLMADGKIIAWLATVRATHLPTCAYQDADGSCSFDEKPDKQRTIHNIRAHAITRAKNRAILDLVGFGEISAEEMIEEDARPAKQPATKNRPATKGLISEAQGKRMYAIAKGDAGLIKNVIAVHGYTDSAQVTKADYEAICTNIEQIVNGESAADAAPADTPAADYAGYDDPFADDSPHCCQCGAPLTKARATLSEAGFGNRYCITCRP